MFSTARKYESQPSPWARPATLRFLARGKAGQQGAPAVRRGPLPTGLPAFGPGTGMLVSRRFLSLEGIALESHLPNRPMIVWLASYPRSGNTMLRAMLRQAFGLKSYSMYDDPTDIGMNPAVGKQVGHQSLGTSFEEFYLREMSSNKLTLVKTHDKP